MRHVFPVMGTVVSIETPRAVIPDRVRQRVEEVFHLADLTFSMYRPDSELRRIAAGTLDVDAASPVVQLACTQALDWWDLTEGAFDPYRPDGILDLSGIVKALAIGAGGLRLDEWGGSDWMINAGGDILTSGAGEWSIGIADPAARGLVGSVLITAPRRSVASSGSAERGDHIWGPAATEFLQATVIADDVVTADVLATAIIAGGAVARDLVTERFDCDVLTITRSGDLAVTPGFRRMLQAGSNGPGGDRSPSDSPRPRTTTGKDP